MKRQPITIDFETYWAQDFSLTNINFIEYIHDERYETISVAIKHGAGETNCYSGEENVRAALCAIQWDQHACIAHNGNEFDFPILVWKYGCHPKMFIDTLCLSRPKHQSEVGGSLKKLSAHYGLPEKNNEALLKTKGKRLADFTEYERAAMEAYNIQDVDNTYALFKLLKPDTPAMELVYSDMTARMICYPTVRLDTELLERTAHALKIQKQAVLESLIEPLGVLTTDDVKTELSSANKFAAALESVGVAPPRKISRVTGKETFALAKTDEDFLALQTHDDPRVQALVAARLDAKSTILETRLHTMRACGLVMGGRMPVPLGYHAATTGRWGGRVWNPQNLPRIDPKNPKLTDALRLSLSAPAGHVFVVSDLSGIELRVNHYLWDVKSTRAAYDANPEADLYKDFASTLYGKPRDEVTKSERQLAKVAQLGLGFGAGAATFRKVAKIMGGIDLDEVEAKRVVDLWRVKYVDIVKGWHRCQRAIEAMYIGAEFSPDPRGLVNTAGNRVLLPSGRTLYYPGLHVTQDESGKAQYKYGSGRALSKVYSGLFDENIVQAIARDVIAEQAIRIRHETGCTPSHMVHDELVYVLPEKQAVAHLEAVNKVMRAAPTWLPGLVLWSEGGIARRYGHAK